MSEHQQSFQKLIQSLLPSVQKVFSRTTSYASLILSTPNFVRVNTFVLLKKINKK